MTEIHDSSDNEAFINDFIEKIRFAHTQMASWRKTLAPSVYNPMSWRGVDNQKKYMEDLLVEIGWQAIQLYEAGEFEDSSCSEESDDESIFSEEEILNEEDSIDESGFFLEVSQEKQEIILTEEEEHDVLESKISEEELVDFRTSLFFDSNEKEEVLERSEDYSSIDMWIESNVLLSSESTKEERDHFFRVIDSVIARGFFDCWKRESSKIYDDIVRFFISSLLYIQSFPKHERPQSALGDGAFHFLIAKIPVSSKLSKKIARYQVSEDSSEDYLKRMNMFWERINDFFLKQPQQKIVPFNEEIALNRLRSLLTKDSEKEIFYHLLTMVKHGMSTDPRLVRLLSTREDHEKLTNHPRFSSLRKSLRSIEKDKKVAIKTQWEHADFFAEKNITVIGGEKKRVLLKHFAQIVPQANVSWVATSASSFAKRVQSLTKSIEQESVDFVLVIQNFIGHSAAGPLFKAFKTKNTKTHVEMIENGYGKREIKLALERSLRAKNEL